MSLIVFALATFAAASPGSLADLQGRFIDYVRNYSKVPWAIVYVQHPPYHCYVG